jgi:hypothetical protein
MRIAAGRALWIGAGRGKLAASAVISPVLALPFAEVTMTSDSGILGGPEPDEEGTDVFTGSDPGPEDELAGGEEPDEESTDVLSGSDPGPEDELAGGEEPDEEETDLFREH